MLLNDTSYQCQLVTYVYYNDLNTILVEYRVEFSAYLILSRENIHAAKPHAKHSIMY